MLVDGERVWHGLTSIFRPKSRDGLTELLQRNLQRLSVVSCLWLSTLTLAFWSLRVPFSLFAIFIGLMEVIPYVGATLGITTVTVVAFIDWWLALQVLAVAIALQQVKTTRFSNAGNLTGLSPVIIFISLILGAQLGLLGVICDSAHRCWEKSGGNCSRSDPATPTGSFSTTPLTRIVLSQRSMWHLAPTPPMAMDFQNSDHPSGDGTLADIRPLQFWSRNDNLYLNLQKYRTN